MKKYLLITILIFIIFFISCTPPVYIPNSLNTPLLKEKGETNIGYNASFAGNDIQISYAISKNIGLMTNGTYYSHVHEDQYRKHKFGELGIGYFYHPNKYIVGEIFIGAGLGANSIREEIVDLSFLFFFFFFPISEEEGEEELLDVSADYVRLFLQPTFGVYTEIFEGGFSLRMCYINFYEINHSNIDFPKEKILFEPVVFLRVGPPNIKFQTHFGLSSTPFQDPEAYYEDLILSCGFNVRLNIE